MCTDEYIGVCVGCQITLQDSWGMKKGLISGLIVQAS